MCRVSKKIVDLHSGQIRVSSEGLGKGCTFEVELPIVAPTLENQRTHFGNRIVPVGEVASSHGSNPPMVKISSRGPYYSGNLLDPCAKLAEDVTHMHVLIVDDSSINRKFMTRLLATGSITADDADDGIAAVAKVIESESDQDARKFDMVLMDVRSALFLYKNDC